jgi:hypothetical protein
MFPLLFLNQVTFFTKFGYHSRLILFTFLKSEIGSGSMRLGDGSDTSAPEIVCRSRSSKKMPLLLHKSLFNMHKCKFIFQVDCDRYKLYMNVVYKPTGTNMATWCETLRFCPTSRICTLVVTRNIHKTYKVASNKRVLTHVIR